MNYRLLRILISLIIGVSTLTVNPAHTKESHPATAVLSLLGSNINQVSLRLQSPAYTISPADNLNHETSTIQIAGIVNDSTPGNLRLPRLSRLVAIPPGVDVSLSFQSPGSQLVPGTYQISVAGQPQPLAEDLTPGAYLPDTLLDPMVNESTGNYYPAEPVQVSDEAWLRGQRLVRVDFYPIQYAVTRGSLLWHPTLEVTLQFTPIAGTAPVTAPHQQTSSPLDELAEDLVVNPESARGWRDPAWQTTAPIPLGRSATTADYAETRYKISVNEDGLYQVTGAELAAAGLDISQVNPQDFSLTNQGSGVAILIQDVDGNDGEADGVYSATDRVVFYGEQFRGDRMAERYAGEDDLWARMPTGWQPHMSAEMFEKYTDTNVYWLDVDGPAGLRMAEVNGIPVGNNLIPGVFPEVVHAEQEIFWDVKPRLVEDSWFWDKFIMTTIPTTRNFPIELSGIEFVGGLAKLTGVLSSYSYEVVYPPPAYRLELSVNGVSVFNGIWEAFDRYLLDVEFEPSILHDGQNSITLSITLLSGSAGQWLYVNWFEISYARRFLAQADQLFFNYPESGIPWQYRVEGFTLPQIGVLDITSPLAPAVIQARPWTGAENPFGIEFQSEHTETGRYLVTASPLKAALEVTSYTFKNLHAETSGADYLIISPVEFIQAAQVLADYRAAQGLRTRVFNLEDVINEFNDGIYHSLAIKSFLAYAFAHWTQPAPSYVVLVGSGHWNFFGRPGPNPSNPYLATRIYMPPHLVWVDPWQGEVDSATALAAVVGEDNLPDLAIGRIPVDSPEELATVIQKIISFETRPHTIESDRLLFIADNQPDLAGDFMTLSEQVISDSIPSYQQVDRVYLNDYLELKDGKKCTPDLFGRDCPEATQAILDDLNNGAFEFVNYTGHAFTYGWADELLLKTTRLPDRINNPDYDDLASLHNASHLPVLLSMTCLDGYWIYPSLRNPSLAVSLLRKAGGGITAAYSPTGLGLAHGHDVLNKAFYDSLYIHGVKELGAAVAFSKLKLFETGQNFDLLYTYTIFGDPALRLATTPGWQFLPVLSYQVTP